MAAVTATISKIQKAAAQAQSSALPPVAVVGGPVVMQMPNAEASVQSQNATAAQANNDAPEV